MAFNAKEFTDLYDYDFTAVGGTKGTTPPPSTDEGRKFRDAIRDAQIEAVGLTVTEGTEPADEAIDEGLTKLSQTQRDTLRDDILELVVEFCKGQPSRDEILRLPAIHRVGFVNSILDLSRPLS